MSIQTSAQTCSADGQGFLGCFFFYQDYGASVAARQHSRLKCRRARSILGVTVLDQSLKLSDCAGLKTKVSLL
jgi:hypothetical protein